jgi:hypothetical protein
MDMYSTHKLRDVQIMRIYISTIYILYLMVLQKVYLMMGKMIVIPPLENYL